MLRIHSEHKFHNISNINNRIVIATLSSPTHSYVYMGWSKDFMKQNADIFENQFFCKIHLLIIDFKSKELKYSCVPN